MTVATFTQRFEAPAERVWDYVRWHGVARLEQYSGAFFEKIEFQGDAEEPGVTKRIYPHDALPILERLEEVDASDFTYRYRLLDVGSLPITDYRGYVRVTPAGPRACFLLLECEFVAVDVSDDEWIAMWRDIETNLVNEIRPLVEKAAG